MTRPRFSSAPIAFALALSAFSIAEAQDKGSLDPAPLPPLANPNNPGLAAKELFGRALTPAEAQVRSIGFYSRGCLAGAKALPVDGDPSIVFPSEARYVGEHATTWIDEQVFVDRPGDWIADRVRGKRVGVYGMDYVMTVRDYAALAGACMLVGWDVEFDHARMVKSELELESVRDSVRINTEGFWIFLEAFEPTRTIDL